MRARLFVLLMTALALVGCDRITGAGQQKILDAEAIGYACRVSEKVPEDCIKENETKSPSSILDGWKAADLDIQDKNIRLAPTVAPAAATGAAPVAAPVAAEAKPVTEKPGTKKAIELPAKPGNPATEKKAAP